jgi:hypothetical protein
MAKPGQEGDPVHPLLAYVTISKRFWVQIAISRTFSAVDRSRSKAASPEFGFISLKG